MLQIQTANLPQDQQKHLHQDFLADEQAYLQMRDSLLAQYPGQWVAVQGGKVIAAGPGLMDVMEQASSFGGHPYIALVGAEDPVVFRVRRGQVGCGDMAGLDAPERRRTMELNCESASTATFIRQIAAIVGQPCR
jgi:hypothetical protein